MIYRIIAEAYADRAVIVLKLVTPQGETEVSRAIRTFTRFERRLPAIEQDALTLDFAFVVYGEHFVGQISESNISPSLLAHLRANSSDE